MLKQPSRDIHELNLRFATIDWCLTPENFENVVKLRELLKNILNVSASSQITAKLVIGSR
jgi:hypothetical protein